MCSDTHSYGKFVRQISAGIAMSFHGYPQPLRRIPGQYFEIGYDRLLSNSSLLIHEHIYIFLDAIWPTSVKLKHRR